MSKHKHISPLVEHPWLNKSISNHFRSPKGPWARSCCLGQCNEHSVYSKLFPYYGESGCRTCTVCELLLMEIYRTFRQVRGQNLMNNVIYEYTDAHTHTRRDTQTHSKENTSRQPKKTAAAAVHARVWTPVGTGLRVSMPRDGAIMARPKVAGWQRRLTGHKYLRNKLSHRDVRVSSCRLFL